MGFFSYLQVPTILFMVIVAPLWIIFNYLSKRNAAKGLSEHERQQLEDLLVKLDKVADRVATLEEILYDKHRNWRDTEERERHQK